ncbi:MAG: hypothetical protein AB8E15_09690 [Bdellovibrionales bacterium]
MDRFCPRCNNSDIFHIRNGFFKSGSRRIQRYRCTLCKKEFSDATFQLRYRMRKRKIHGQVERELCTGSSLRSAAKNLNITYNTIVRKLDFLAKKARFMERKRVENLKGLQEIQFDDMETFEHSKLKPLSITVAVQKKTRLLLGANVSSMPAKGLIAAKSRKKYGHRIDGRKKQREKLLKKLLPVLDPEVIFETDEHPHYPKGIKKYYPKATHITFKGRRGCVVGQGELKAGGFDPLFSLNHTCAMLRYRVSRLIRRTWVTTKDPARLQDHIDIYIHYHNRELLKGS